MREGTIVDATLIAASPSTKNQNKARDPETPHSKMGMTGINAITSDRTKDRMRYCTALIFYLILLPSVQSKNTMSSHRLKVIATCGVAPACAFDGNDLSVRVEIVNIEDHEAAFPLLFYRKAGPILELKNIRTGVLKNVRRSLVDLELLKEIVIIPPANSIYYVFKIPESDIREIGGNDTEIMATFTVSMDLTGSIAAAPVKFEGAGSIPINIVNRR